MKRTEVKELIDRLNSYKEFNYALLFHEDVFSGEILATYILSPDSFEIDSKGRIKEVTIPSILSILIDCEELKELDIK